MQALTKYETGFLALASVMLAAAACGDGSSSSKESTGATGTGGVGGIGAGGSDATTTNSTSAATTATNTATGTGGAGGASSTTEGSGGTGGASGAAGAEGDSDSGGTAGTGGSGPIGVIGVLGEPCESSGQLACAGNHQKLTVVCGGDGEWEVNQTCGETEYCDSSEGETSGLCLEPDEECAERAPGELFCEGASVVTCNADGLRTDVVEECSSPCTDGACEEFGAPCPTEAFINCSTQCGGFNPSGCYKSEEDYCVLGVPLADYLEDYGDSMVVRTASYAELCEAGERCGEAVRSMSVSSYYVTLRVSVDAPWGVVSDARRADDECAERRQCEIVEMDNSTTLARALVETNDPDAGPANVLVEVVDEGTPCP